MTNTKLAMGGLFLYMVAGLPAADALKLADRERAESEFRRAQTQFLSATNNATNVWQFARACFDCAELATNATRRAELARLGIAAGRQLVAREPKSAPGHYYLAMNYGELADAEAPSLAAYKLVKEVEREFKTATELDEQFDFAGPVRNLGELYLQAPGWPVSVGGKRKAREWLERAATLAPDYPENLLNLAEAQLKWHQAAEADKTLQKLDLLWPAAQTNLAGAKWESSWEDWRVRRLTVKAEAVRLAPVKKN